MAPMTIKRLPRPRDPIQLGKLIVDIATGQVEDREADGKSEAVSELARQGGLKGGPARARKLAPSDRKAIAEKAARTRWAKVKSHQS